MGKNGSVSIALWCLLAVPAMAGNGVFLHGIGAVNSSMGGVSTGLAVEPIGALMFNPALLTQFEGYQIGFSAEVFSDQPKATATFDNTPGRPDGSFTTKGNTELGVIPAIGFSYRSPNKPWAFGFGLLGVAGFRTDWPQDSSNPIFLPQPDGFGTVKTDLVIAKIPLSFAYQVNPKLSLGIGLAIFQGSLAITPLPPSAPDCTLPAPGSGLAVDCFYAAADNKVTSYALALDLGLYYEIDDTWSLGLGFTSAQDYDDYTWESAVALPYIRHPDGSVTLNPALGTRKVLRYPLDGPQIISAGLGYSPGEKLKLGLDVRFVQYSTVDGAGGVGGFRPDRGLNEIGWDDIWIGAIGFQYQRSERYTWRGGFNYSQTPIREEVVFTSLGTPPTFKDHYTVGLGIQLTEKLQVNLASYYAPERSVSGPLLSAFLVETPQTLDQQILPGGTFTISERIFSVLAAVAYRF